MKKSKKRNKNRAQRPSGRKVSHATAAQSQVDAIFNQAVASHKAGDVAGAISFYQQALSLNNAHAPAFNGLGLIMHGADDTATASELIREAIRLDGTQASYHFNLGVVLQSTGDLPAAIASYQQAVALNKTYVQALENMGVACQDLGDVAAAQAAYESALRINSRSAISLQNLGTLYYGLGAASRAAKIFETALKYHPAALEVRSKSAYLQLAKGDFAAGWQAYPWVYYTDIYAERNNMRVVPFPKWEGSALTGKRILLVADQGIGDEVMFASCLTEILDEAGSCIVECDPRLAPLYRRSFPSAELLLRQPRDDFYWQRALGNIDYFLPIVELPRFYRQKAEDFAPADAYLVVDSAKRRAWRQILDQLPEDVHVGVSWAGGVEPRAIAARTFPLMDWAEIFAVPGVNFIDLQYGDHRDEIADFHAHASGKLHCLEGVDPLQELDDFHALIAALDLVITVDNSTAHFAGAVGTPVWVMLPRHIDWRWQLSGAGCLWYASAKLYRPRQTGEEDKAAVLGAVKNDLLAQLNSDRICASDTPALASDRSRPSPDSDTAATLNSNAKYLTSFAPGASADASGYAVLLNDTSNWYHWGCSGTSLAIHDQLRLTWPAVVSIPIYKTNNLGGLPEASADFDSAERFQAFAVQYPGLVDKLSGAGAVYINGEGTLHDLSAQSVGLLYLAYIAKAHLSRPVHIINHSCYPATRDATEKPLAEAIYTKVYQQMDTVALREPVSVDVLAALGVPSRQAFDCLPLFIDKYYAASKVPGSDANATGSATRKTVVFAGSVAWDAPIVKSVKAVIKRLAADHYTVQVLMGARANPASDDLQFVDALGDVFGPSVQLLNAGSELAWLRVIDAADLLISGRFHHSVAAAFVATPFIVMDSNTPKIKGLLDMLAVDNYLDPKPAALADRLYRAAVNTLNTPGPALVGEATKKRLLALSASNFTA